MINSRLVGFDIFSNTADRYLVLLKGRGEPIYSLQVHAVNSNEEAVKSISINLTTEELSHLLDAAHELIKTGVPK